MTYGDFRFIRMCIYIGLIVICCILGFAGIL